MSDLESTPSTELQYLEQKLDILITKFKCSKQENSDLKIKQDVLLKEQAKLLEKIALAKIRVETVIARLKSMQQKE